MVVPDLLHGFQEHLSLLALLHGVLRDVRGEGGYDVLLRKLVQILHDELLRPSVQLVAILVQNHIIRIAVIFFEREVCGIVVLNLDDVPGELRPGFVHGHIRPVLSPNQRVPHEKGVAQIVPFAPVSVADRQTQSPYCHCESPHNSSLAPSYSWWNLGHIL